MVGGSGLSLSLRCSPEWIPPLSWSVDQVISRVDPALSLRLGGWGGPTTVVAVKQEGGSPNLSFQVLQT